MEISFQKKNSQQDGVVNDKFIRAVEGTCVPVPGEDIDTDRIIPARFLTSLTFEGLGALAFYDERFDGSGYPHGYKGDSINFYSQLLGIVDVYEALTHNRPWRKAVHQHDGLKIMLDMANESFSRQMVKILIDGLSLFPSGALVKLSTGEVARVVDTNPGMITRPKVEIVEYSGKIEAGKKFIDLSRNTSVLIVSPVQGCA